MNKDWKQWEGQIVNGKFPLRKYLGGSDHSAAFLTERNEQGLEKAAIKLIPANLRNAELQLARWELAAGLSHARLIQCFHAGRSQLGGVDLLFVVTEYAEENLSQVLLERSLTPQETREMLISTLDALSFIHDQGLVHGRLKPSNIMAVNDQIKVSSDCLCRMGESSGSLEQLSAYDPPECVSGVISSAGDVWSLGVTLLEVLTQKLPDRVETEQGDPSVPATVPMPFRDFAQRCLRRDPQHRWTVSEFAERLQIDSLSSDGRTMLKPTPQQVLPKKSYVVPVGVVSLVLAGVLAVSWLLNRQPGNQGAPSNAIDQQRIPTAPEEALATLPQSEKEPPTLPSAPVPGKVLAEALPNVPRSARDTITGTVRVSVKVHVDQSGKVTAAEIDSPGPSRYFARLALQASRRWTFTPPTVNGQNVSSEWILRFGFTRTETRVDPVQSVP